MNSFRTKLSRYFMATSPHHPNCMHLSVHLSIQTSSRPSIPPFTHPASIHTSLTHLPMHPIHFYPSIHPYAHQTISLKSIHLHSSFPTSIAVIFIPYSASPYPSIHSSTQPPIYPSHLLFSPSVWPMSIYPFIRFKYIHSSAYSIIQKVAHPLILYPSLRFQSNRSIDMDWTMN